MRPAPEAAAQGPRHLDHVPRRPRRCGPPHVGTPGDAVQRVHPRGPRARPAHLAGRPLDDETERDHRVAARHRAQLDGRGDTADEPDETAGFRRIVVTEPGHPYVGAWWPAGHGLGYEHGFTHQVVDLVTAIAGGTDPAPSFADGLQVQRVLAAVESSSESGRWESVPQ